MRKVKILSLFTSIILLFSIFGCSMVGNAVFAPNFELNSEGVYMINLDTDIVVVSKNPDKKLYPASTTKIMTCLVALENVKDFDAFVEIPYDCYNEFSEGNPNFSDVSAADIQIHQSNVTYMDCLYALMVSSACEAANIIAYNVGGGNRETFVTMMNDTAKKIGCKNTHFSNAHGLFEEENYTTAYDLAMITKYAIENYPSFMKICGSTSYEMPPNSRNPDGYTQYTTNKFMVPSSDYYYEGVTGVKTGSIDYYYYKTGETWNTYEKKAGSRALVTTATKNGYTYLTVTLGAPYFNEDGTLPEKQLSFVDHKNLYDWAFEDFEYTLVVSKGQQIMETEIDKGKDADRVGIISTEDYYTLFPKSLDISSIQMIRPIVPTLEAPVEKDYPVGNLELVFGGETLAKLKLVTEDSVELDMTAYYKEKISDMLGSTQFKAILITLGALIVVYVAANIMYKQHRRKVTEANRRRKIQVSPQARKQVRRPQQGSPYDRNRRR